MTDEPFPHRLRLTVPDPDAALSRAETRYRCSVASEERGEELAGTASTVSAFLLMEEPGPWGPAVLRCLRLPDAVRERAARWERELGLRPLLIRRPGRSPDSPRRVFVVNARHGWAQSATVDSLDAVAGWNLDAVASPDGVGLTPHPDPLVLACTHGRHDACCAERGRPVARALADAFGDLVWETSHLGGDRFAANLLVLPDGAAYGRLDAASAPGIVRDHLDGRVSLDHFRGRTTASWPAQYAEQVVRERLGETRLAAVSSRVLARDTRKAVVEVSVGGVPREVTVEIGESPEALLTCQAPRPATAPRYRVG